MQIDYFQIVIASMISNMVKIKPAFQKKSYSITRKTYGAMNGQSTTGFELHNLRLNRLRLQSCPWEDYIV
jgi:hypothetical protein